MGQKSDYWDVLGHWWDISTHVNFGDFHMSCIYMYMIKLKNTHALGRSLVIFKIATSRS